ncbi:MAG: DUF1365 domain-containing protein [Candidatus Omnitrophica bacterium]|nr:DUF1365 domain-containing protein [Candidatus Omnitrophota bacterium]
MELNSCLFEINITHCRIRPKRNQFRNKIFMFYLDLDEIDALVKTNYLLSRNRANVYNFRDEDHFEINGKTIKEKVLTYLSGQGVDLEGGRIMLLTNLRTFGYIFNPVSFYFCFDRQGAPRCVVVEIGNTFGEIKPFFIGREALDNGQFVSQQKKYYYISPFIALDVPMDFRLKVPNENLDIKIDDSDTQGKFLFTVMSGQARKITNGNLLWCTIKYPLITLKVIFLIHWHALLLWLKKVPYHEKTSNSDLQKGVYRVWSKGRKMPERKFA